MVRIALCAGTRKDLVACLEQAHGNHAPRLIRRIHALLGLAGGRPAEELRQLLVDGPEAAGHTSDCWIAAIIADLIHRRFKVN